MNRPTSWRYLVVWPYMLALINIAFAIFPTGRKFIPSELAILLGMAYGAACVAVHGLLIRLARKRAPTDEGGKLRKRPVGGSLIFGIFLQFGAGTVGLAEGVGSIYTQAFGSLSESSYTVSGEPVRAKKPRCLKYWFAEISYAQNILGSPCIEIEYQVQSRFVFSGRSSALGFKYYEYTVQPPSFHNP